MAEMGLSSIQVRLLQSQLGWHQRLRRCNSVKIHLVMLKKVPDTSKCLHGTQALLFF